MYTQNSRVNPYTMKELLQLWLQNSVPAKVRTSLNATNKATGTVSIACGGGVGINLVVGWLQFDPSVPLKQVFNGCCAECFFAAIRRLR